MLNPVCFQPRRAVEIVFGCLMACGGGFGVPSSFGDSLALLVPITTTVIAPIAVKPVTSTPIVTTVIAPTIKPVAPSPTVTTPIVAAPLSTPQVSPVLTTVNPAPVTVSPLSAPALTQIQSAGQVLASSSQNVVVNSLGALVVTSPPSSPLVLSSSALNNSQIQIPNNQPVSITAGNATLTYVDKSGGSQLLVRNVAGSPTLEVGSGRVEIKSTASGNLIPLATDSGGKALATLTTTSAGDSVTVIKSGNQSQLFVDSGKVNCLSAGQNAAVPIFQGENGKLDGTGKLTGISLGSAEGSKQLPGDPLPRQSWQAADVKVPRLDGKLARFDNQLSLVDIVQGAFTEIFGVSGGQLTYDNVTGLLTLTVGNTTINLLPLGSPQVVPYSLHSSATASGAFNFASQGIQVTLSSAVGYFNDLLQAIKDLDGAGQITLKSDGILEITINTTRYAAIPGATASQPANPVAKAGFEVDPSGLVQFRNHLGAVQTLYPSFANINRLTTVASDAAPGSNLASNVNGTLVLNMSGKSYTLVPEYALRDLPSGHAADPYWQDSNLLYLNNGDNTAQGFQVK